ncbi:MAG: DUF5711 family protein [Candidatus Omnitrophota bacterium]|nr:DUF5711 family protein [Candidatus Omnitrophota bacterium]
MSVQKTLQMLIGSALFGLLLTLALIAGENAASKEFAVEYKSGEDVVDVVYDTAIMDVAAANAIGVAKLEGRLKSESIKVRYPKVVMIKDEEVKTGTHVKSLRFLNEKGKLQKEIPVQRFIPGKQNPAEIMVSKNRKYISIRSVRESDEKGGIKKADSVTLDTDGNVLWKINHQLSRTEVSTNGEYIVGEYDCDDCPVQIFNKTGLIGEIEKNIMGFDLDFSDDGSFFALTTTTIDWKMKTAKHGDRYAGHLHVYDSTGKELWRKDNIAKGDGSFCEVKISSDNIISAITGVDGYKLYQFDKKGNLLKEEQGNSETLRNFKK